VAYRTPVRPGCRHSRGVQAFCTPRVRTHPRRTRKLYASDTVRWGLPSLLPRWPRFRSAPKIRSRRALFPNLVSIRAAPRRRPSICAAPRRRHPPEEQQATRPRSSRPPAREEQQATRPRSSRPPARGAAGLLPRLQQEEEQQVEEQQVFFPGYSQGPRRRLIRKVSARACPANFPCNPCNLVCK
jgi:hypothetical protein